MHTITLITGGGRSGKSRMALSLARSYGERRVFIATAEAFDGEMRERIANHRRERGNDFTTIEEPMDPAGAFGALPGDTGVAVLDCLTVWLGNLTYRRGSGPYPEIERFLAALDHPPCPVVIVTNEVGMGIIPENETARRFRDLAGILNQETARRADRVILMVSGMPLFLKEGSL